MGSFEENPLGLHDMLGNVGEVTEDCAHESYEGAPADGGAWLTGDCSRRMMRGGWWVGKAEFVRSAIRVKKAADTRSAIAGMRVALTLE